MNARAAAANIAWWVSSRRAWRAFRPALADPQAAQADVLFSTIRSAADSAFGREHGFADIRSVADFQRHVPIRDYSDHEPWIRRIRAGEPSVLTADPVRSFAATSGTTTGRKLIPYTRGLQQQFNRAISPWIVDLFRTHPALLGGRAYWSISPAIQPRDDEQSAVPIGFEDDAEYLGLIGRILTRTVMAVPSSVRHLQDLDSWRAASHRHLQRSRDLRLISIWHPSFLQLLLGDHLPRARSIWPKLTLISCWADAHASLAADALAEHFPGVVIQPKGLIATEGIVSIPFQNRWPLAIRSHFLEFITSTGDMRLAHELEAGQTYEVLLTTAGGLYRYRLGDLVRVDGIVSRTPSVRFIGRTGNVSDRFGEKLDEAFVVRVIADLQTQAGVRWSFAMLAPDGARYTLYVSGTCHASLADDLDRMLRQNPHYDYCRELGQLGPASVVIAPRDADAIVARRLTESGQRLGDVKPVALSQLDDWTRRFSAGG